MALTSLDIHNKEFNVRFRGYDQDQVNDFLDQIIKDYEALIRRNEDLERALKDNQEKVAYFTDLKDALNQSIIVAQDAADKVKVNAQRESEIIQDDAEKQARQLLNESTDKSNQILQDASEKARQITVETDDLKKQTRIFRQRLQVMLESQLEIVKSPEWNELLNDDQIANNSQINQQLNYNRNPQNDYDRNQYNNYSNDNLAQDYSFNDADDNPYTTFDQAQNEMPGNSEPNNGPQQPYAPHQTAYQFDDTTAANDAQGQAITPDELKAKAQTADPKINPGDNSHTQMNLPQQAQLDSDYFEQKPDQNRPTIIFPDDATSGTMNNNKPKGN
ncbi:DivIVA domain-containing protein [Agrilactobacillus yilanensis]